MKVRSVIVNREISFTFDEILRHLDDEFKDTLKAALCSRDLQGVICYSNFSDKIEFSLMHEENLKDLENV